MPIQGVTDGLGRELQPWVPMWVFLPWEDRAQKNHGQTLARLAERGGLSPDEALAILTDQDVHITFTRGEIYRRLCRMVDAAKVYQAAAEARATALENERNTLASRLADTEARLLWEESHHKTTQARATAAEEQAKLAIAGRDYWRNGTRNGQLAKIARAESARLAGELEAAEQHVKIAREATEREHETVLRLTGELAQVRETNGLLLRSLRVMADDFNGPA